MARRKRSRSSGSSEGTSEGTISAGSSTAPWRPVYDGKSYHEFTIMTSDQINDRSYVGALNTNQSLAFEQTKPGRAVTTPGDNSVGNTSNIGQIYDLELAARTVFNKIPRVLTTPGNLNETQLLDDLKYYISTINKMWMVMMQAAAWKGLANSLPPVKGYLDNYIADIGLKPWQFRNMQTVLRNYPAPAALVQYHAMWYAAKAHPRSEDIFHIYPIGTASSNEETSLSTAVGGDDTMNEREVFKWMQTYDAAMKDSANISDLYELKQLLNAAGWSAIEAPDEIGIINECMVGSSSYERTPDN
jgi:hypothetical protein